MCIPVGCACSAGTLGNLYLQHMKARTRQKMTQSPNRVQVHLQDIILIWIGKLLCQRSTLDSGTCRPMARSGHQKKYARIIDL